MHYTSLLLLDTHPTIHPGTTVLFEIGFFLLIRKERDLRRTRLLRKTYKENMEIAAVWK